MSATLKHYKSLQARTLGNPAMLWALLIVTLVYFCSGQALLAQDLYQERVILEGQDLPLDSLFRNQNNILYCPLDLLKERLSLSYQYNQGSKIVIVKTRDKTLKLQVGNTLAVINEAWKYMKAPAQDIDGRIIVPLMDVAEYLGAAATYRGFLPMAPEDGRRTPNSHMPPAEQKGTVRDAAEADDSPFRFPPSLEGPDETPATRQSQHSSSSMPQDYSRAGAQMEEVRDEPVMDSTPRHPRGRREKRRVVFRKPAPEKPREKSPWSMKGKVGIGVTLNAYQPDGEDIGSAVESHLLWGGRFSAGISNHWSLEALVEEWEDSHELTQYSNFPLPGNGKLTVQPFTLSLKCHFMKDSPFKPYLAIGATRFNVGFAFNDTVNTPYSGKETCWGPTIQAGGEYFVTRNFSMYSGFRYSWGEIGFDVKPLLRFAEVQLMIFTGAEALISGSTDRPINAAQGSVRARGARSGYLAAKTLSPLFEGFSFI